MLLKLLLLLLFGVAADVAAFAGAWRRGGFESEMTVVAGMGLGIFFRILPVPAVDRALGLRNWLPPRGPPALAGDLGLRCALLGLGGSGLSRSSRPEERLLREEPFPLPVERVEGKVVAELRSPDILGPRLAVLSEFVVEVDSSSFGGGGVIVIVGFAGAWLLGGDATGDKGIPNKNEARPRVADMGLPAAAAFF